MRLRLSWAAVATDQAAGRSPWNGRRFVSAVKRAVQPAEPAG
jgi:hypothetical protein